MKTTLPGLLAAFGSLALLTSPVTLVSTRAATFEVDVNNSNGDTKTWNWSDLSTWKGPPSSYPASSEDKVLFPTNATSSRAVHLDLSSVTIGELEATGSGETHRFDAAASHATTLTIGALTKTGTSLLTFSNGTKEGSLSVAVDHLTLGSGASLEIGHPGLGSLAAFNVNETSTINGTFTFDGVAGRTPGLNRIRLGTLELNGTLYVGGRGNTDAVLNVHSLTGTGTLIFTTNSHKPAEGTSHGTLEIDSTNVTPADYGGIINLGVTDPGFTFSIVKKGPGTQIFSRTAGNPYNGGTIIEGGILAFSTTSTSNGVSGLGYGTVEVRNGGTLAGNGRIRLNAAESTIVRSGGVIAPSAHLASGFATLTFNSHAQPTGAILTLEEGATFRFRLGPGNGSDLIAFINYHDGGLALPSGGLTLQFEQAQEGTFTLFSFNAIGSSELEALSQSLLFDAEGFQGVFGHDASTIFVTVTTIPEPGTVALVVIGLSAVVAMRWTGRRKS